MGIPGLYRHLITKYRQTYSNKTSKRINHFYIDFNPIIYNSYNTIKKDIGNYSFFVKENYIIKETINQLDELINFVNPSKSLMICVDGPVPFCKIIQQRNRRYKRLLDGKIKEQIYQKFNKKVNEPWDTTNITPGTKFMGKLNNALRLYVKNNRKFNIKLNDSSQFGEGEHKFLKDIEQLPLDDVICVYSNDGDLLVLLNRFLHNNIYLVSDRHNILDEEFKNDKFIYFSINEFQKSLMQEYDLLEFDKNSIMYDFMFITMICGNDFVKPIFYLKMKEKNTLNIIISIYKECLFEKKTYLIKKNAKDFDIDLNFLKLFFQKLKEIEKNKICNYFRKLQNITRNKRQNTNREELEEHQQEYMNFIHTYYANVNHPYHDDYIKEFNKIKFSRNTNYYNWKKKFYKTFTENLDIKRLCFFYIKSLIFTFKYYLYGLPSWSWAYRSSIAPLPSDILNYLDGFSKEELFKFKSQKCLPQKVQLMMNIPITHKIFPRYLKQKIDKNNDEKFKKYFPTKFELDLFLGEKYIYTEPKIPIPDIRLFMKYYYEK